MSSLLGNVKVIKCPPTSAPQTDKNCSPKAYLENELNTNANPHEQASNNVHFWTKKN